MGDMSTETSMEDILSSIKRIIAEEGDAAVQAPRTRKPARAPVADAPRPMSPPVAHLPMDEDDDDGILDLDGFPAPPPPVRAQREAQPMAHDAPVSASTAETILSDRAAQASSRSLDTLAKIVVRPEVQGSDTLEGLVREMLRPMLRDWLDANLPGMVEAMVAREITRITGRD